MVNRIFLTVTYRCGRPIAAYVQLPREEGDRAVRTDRIDDVFLVDRAADGRPIGVDITDPTELSADRLVDLLRSLGLPEIDREEFRPLIAA
jgi:hypothetical protein